MPPGQNNGIEKLKLQKIFNGPLSFEEKQIVSNFMFLWVRFNTKISIKWRILKKHQTEKEKHKYEAG